MSTPLLALENLVLTFPGESGRVAVVDKVSLTIGRGETLALIGELGMRQIPDCPRHHAAAPKARPH